MVEQQQIAAESLDTVQFTMDSDQHNPSEESTTSDVEQSADIQIEEEQVVTIVFTSGNRLGASIPNLSPRKQEEWQQRLRSAFQQATDFAIGQGVDLFIQAGDLFDSATPDERDRDFVAARLAQLRQANVRVFALGGTHDTPVDAYAVTDKEVLAPQLSYARLGALTYFPPNTFELEPVMMNIRGTLVGICGLSTLTDKVIDPLTPIHVASNIERAAIPLLILYAPVEGLASYSSLSSLPDNQAQVRRDSIERQTAFRTILAGYHHTYQQLRFGQYNVIACGATHSLDFASAGETPGFVFLGLDKNGMRWCKHIAVDTLSVRNLVIHTTEIWGQEATSAQTNATETILTRLQPLCDEGAMVQLRLKGTLTRQQYHQLDFHRLRRFGEEHAFAFAFDDSKLELLPEQEHRTVSQTAITPFSPSFKEDEEKIASSAGERFSPRAELIVLADEWIAAAPDEREKKALRATREELLAALDEIRIL